MTHEISVLVELLVTCSDRLKLFCLLTVSKLDVIDSFSVALTISVTLGTQCDKEKVDWLCKTTC